MLSCCFLDFSAVGPLAFVIGLSQISSSFSLFSKYVKVDIYQNMCIDVLWVMTVNICVHHLQQTNFSHEEFRSVLRNIPYKHI